MRRWFMEWFGSMFRPSRHSRAKRCMPKGLLLRWSSIPPFSFPYLVVAVLFILVSCAHVHTLCFSPSSFCQRLPSLALSFNCLLGWPAWLVLIAWGWPAWPVLIAWDKFLSLWPRQFCLSADWPAWPVLIAWDKFLSLWPDLCFCSLSFLPSLFSHFFLFYGNDLNSLDCLERIR